MKADRAQNHTRLRSSRLGLLMGVFSLSFMSGVGSVHAAPDADLDLSRLPLVVNASVPPNILLSLDDSGSMGWGFLPDGANYGSNDCRYYNSDYNQIYFNPNVTYTPPLQPDGTSFPNANWPNAWIDGFRTSLGTRNLRTSYAVSGDHQGYQDYSQGWRINGFPTGVQSGSQQRAFYCTGTASSSVVIVDAQSNAVRQNFANWFSYYRIRSLTARTALSTTFVNIDPETRVAWQNFYSTSFQLNSSRNIRALDIDSWRSNFFSWLHAPRFSGNTPMFGAFLRAGQYLEGNTGASSLANPYYDEKYERELSCRQSFHVLMTDGYGNVAASSTIGDYDTPNRSIADGRSLSGPAARLYHNKTTGSESYVPGMADMAFYYWSRDLRPTLANNVPSHTSDRRTGTIPGATAEDEIYFNPANDPATWQRMVNFTVTFGAGGTLPYSPNTVREIALDTRKWPRVTGGGSTIDDTWHAAVNSRGQFLSANDPQELVNAMTSIMDNISSRQSRSSSAGSSFFVRGGELEYEASFDSGDWSGDLTATPTGSNPGWTAGSAAQQLDTRSPATRQIFTWVPSAVAPGAGAQQPFLWAQLSTAQRALLNRDAASGVVDSLGSRRVDYIRGVRDREQSSGGTFRDRTSVLGSVIGSNMLYVERPSGGYSARPGFPEGGQTYADFVEDNEGRTPVIYVGANDGMLHAFNASTGREMWAFVPNAVIGSLSRLTTSAFQYLPTVDGELSAVDVYDGARWRTVLLGTLGAGAQAVYAIDVTVPDSPRVLWEFSDQHDPQLGYNYKSLEVSRIQTGEDTFQWVALVPSGYNNSQRDSATTRGMTNPEADTRFSDAGPALFVVDIFSGAQVVKFDGLTGSEGLGPAKSGEYGNNYNAALAVAGDLNGNLWRFDLSRSNRGDVSLVFRGTPDRPITVAPRIFPDQGRGLMFVFGSGKFLEDSDREVSETLPRQALYAVYECLTCSAAQEGDLLDQVLTAAGDGELQIGTTMLLDEDDRGWRLMLGNPSHHNGAVVGERIIDSLLAEFSSGAIIVRSYIPHSDPCQPQGTGAIYVLSAYSGGHLFPGNLNDAGTGHDGSSATPVFPGTGNATVGLIGTVGGGTGGGGGTGPVVPDITEDIRFAPNGCRMIGGVETNICTIPRRRGWRELPVD